MEIEQWDWNVLVMWCHEHFQFQLFFCVVVPDHDLVVNQNSYSSLHIVCLFAFLISLFMHGRMKELFVVSGREKRRWRENLSWSWKPFVKILLIEFLAKKGYLRHIPKQKLFKLHISPLLVYVVYNSSQVCYNFSFKFLSQTPKLACHVIETCFLMLKKKIQNIFLGISKIPSES